MRLSRLSGLAAVDSEVEVGDVPTNNREERAREDGQVVKNSCLLSKGLEALLVGS